MIALTLLMLPPFGGLFATDWIRATFAILALMPVWQRRALSFYGRLGRLTISLSIAGTRPSTRRDCSCNPRRPVSLKSSCEQLRWRVCETSSVAMRM